MVGKIPQVLLEEVSRGTASLLLGAGASCEADFPGAQDLACYLAQRAGLPDSLWLAGQSLDVVAQHLYHQPGYGKAWVRNQIIEYFEKEASRGKASALSRPWGGDEDSVAGHFYHELRSPG